MNEHNHFLMGSVIFTLQGTPKKRMKKSKQKKKGGGGGGGGWGMGRGGRWG